MLTVMDNHVTHEVLTNTPQRSTNHGRHTLLLNKAIEKRQGPILPQAGISIVLSAAKHHDKFGKAEDMVKKIKFILESVLKLFIFGNLFNFHHKI